MDMISDEAGFLLEPAVRKHIEELPADEQERVQLDSLLEALGVSDYAGLEALVEALDLSSDVELRAKGMGTTDKASLKVQPVLVSPDDALRRLRSFVEAENASGIQGGSNKPTVAGPRAGVSRRVMEREREFWRKITKVVDERGRRVFSSLETNLHKYYILLQTREKSLRAVEHAGKQNMELRALLNQYLSSTINKELQIPPTQLI
jgi:dynein regulatry complex protein 1